METQKVVIVTGSRIWKSVSIIWSALEFHRPTLVVTGACPLGADLIAENCAKESHIDYVGMPAKWGGPRGFDKSAGMQRNIRMLRAYPGALVLAFPEGEARGTKHCIAMAKKLGHAVWVYDHVGGKVIHPAAT